MDNMDNMIMDNMDNMIMDFIETHALASEKIMIVYCFLFRDQQFPFWVFFLLKIALLFPLLFNPFSWQLTDKKKIQDIDKKNFF